MSDPCPVCERDTHTNHLNWLVSDTDEFSNPLTGNTVERPKPTDMERIVNALKSVAMYHQDTPAEGVLLDIINELEREA